MILFLMVILYTAMILITSNLVNINSFTPSLLHPPSTPLLPSIPHPISYFPMYVKMCFLTLKYAMAQINVELDLLGINELEALNFHNIISNELNEEDIFNNLQILSDFILIQILFKMCSIISLNICGLNSKFNDLDLISFWNKDNCAPQIICLQEIFSISDPSLFKIPNYHEIFLRTERNLKEEELLFSFINL